MKELKLYHCEICGNLVCMVEDSGVVPVCCGAEMTQVIANTKDAGTEKHVPVLHKEGTSVKICVGEQPHPMTEQHHIRWIALQTDRGVYTRCLTAVDDAGAQFCVDPRETVTAAYAWCNLHGLWKSE